MHKLARVAVAAEACLLVVLADIWLVVKPHSHAHIAGGSQGSMQTCTHTLLCSVQMHKWLEKSQILDVIMASALP